MPPRSIAMATGPEGGGYYEIGRQYQALLARTGVELRLVATADSVENLALLRDPHSGATRARPLPCRRCRPAPARYSRRPARPEGLDRTGRQRLARASAPSCSSAMRSIRMWASC